jgi:hypothetical protein
MAETVRSGEIMSPVVHRANFFICGLVKILLNYGRWDVITTERYSTIGIMRR